MHFMTAFKASYRFLFFYCCIQLNSFEMAKNGKNKKNKNMHTEAFNNQF